MEEEVVVVVKVKAVMLADLVEQELDTHQELLEMQMELQDTLVA